MMKDTAEVKGRASADADADEDAGLTFGLFSGLAEGYGIDCHSPADSKIFLCHTILLELFLVCMVLFVVRRSGITFGFLLSFISLASLSLFQRPAVQGFYRCNCLASAASVG